MTCDKARVKTLSVITAALLLCMLLCPLRAQDDTRGRAELIKACQEKVERIKEGMNRWVSEGRSPHKVGLIMRDEFTPHMQAGRFREAEKVLDRALDILKKEAPVQKPKDLKKYLRKTEETQYLILPIRQAGSLYGGQTNALEKAIERTVERIGEVEEVSSWATVLADDRFAEADDFDTALTMLRFADGARKGNPETRL